MFKGEYQGGPYVEVFSAQGRDPISKKCRVTGNSTNIHKQYDKDAKSYVCILEGEPTTTKIQFPKDEKQTLFLLQRFLVLQIFIPLGRSFSFELGVTDIAQNKRRVFFSSSQKDITVTPLHAKFPLTVLCLGTWLNLCLDLSSLVGETFNGQTFRALESISVTANCRLRKIFTLKIPPADTSGDGLGLASYAETEPLPKGLQLMITPDVRPITQILSYSKLAQRYQDEPPNTPPTTAGNDGSTARQDGQQTHIAFGSKVVIPPHVRRASFKENNENTAGKIARTARSSHSRTKVDHSAPDFRDVGEETATETDRVDVKEKRTHGMPSKSEGKENLEKCVNSNQAVMQPRPPRTSSAGKVRRPVRLKSSSVSKACTARIKTPDSSDKKQDDDDDVDIAEVSVNSEMITPKLSVEHFNDDMPSSSDISATTILNDPGLSSASGILKSGSGNCDKEIILNSYNDHIRRTAEVLTSYNEDIPKTSESLNIDATNNDADFGQGESAKIWRTSISNSAGNVNEGQRSSVADDDIHAQESSKIILTSVVKTSLVSQKLSSDQRVRDERKSFEKENQHVDINNNEQSTESQTNTNNVTKPRLLPLTGENSVFTFSSRPRSPRLSKNKILGSPVVDDAVSPVEQVPEVTVHIEEDAGIDNGQGHGRNRGATLEDDFCKLSDDESRTDEDGIKKLLNSSLSPRHSPMPFHHHLRQSIRSSMLKEIPSPVNDNGYDAQNYQSEPHEATLNQSSASSWRFDLSDSSNSFNQTHQDLHDSLDASHGKLARSMTADSSGILGNDVDDDVLSDASDDTTYSTWRAPPQDLRGNKYQNEMKPPGNEPDLTATISMESRDYCDVFSPLMVLTSSKPDSSVGISPASPARPSRSSHFLQSPGGFGMKHPNDEVEEELDLLYDPFLNCYFDPKTHKYYELS